MSGYRELKIYKISFDLAIRIHQESLKLPAFELYEQGSQIRRSSKGIKDAIAEGYGRRRYKADYIKYLVYSIASCDETINHINTIIVLYPDLIGFNELLTEYDCLGRKINKYLQYVESSWRT
jgi:four helix bundle protein